MAYTLLSMIAWGLWATELPDFSIFLLEINVLFLSCWPLLISAARFPQIALNQGKMHVWWVWYVVISFTTPMFCICFTSEMPLLYHFTHYTNWQRFILVLVAQITDFENVRSLLKLFLDKFKIFIYVVMAKQWETHWYTAI